MASQFLVDGDFFIEIVDNSDGGGFSKKRIEELDKTIWNGTYDGVAFPFERSNGYNGIRQLYSRRGPNENIFKSAWGSSLNCEFVYDISGQYLTPRWIEGIFRGQPTPCQLTRVENNSILLEILVPKPHRIDVKSIFTLICPHYIDITTTIIASPDSFMGDWLGIFWASYIHKPENKTTCFKGRENQSDYPKVISTLEGEHECPRAFVQEGSDLLAKEPDLDGGLFHNIQPYRFTSPYFWGLWRNMVLQMMFKTDQDLRFAIHPGGAGLENPAWDFSIVIKGCKPGRAYSFSSRIVYKPFVNLDDLEEEYKKWNASLKT